MLDWSQQPDHLNKGATVVNVPDFDTLASANSLESSGIQRTQAEAIANAIRNVRVNLATQGDIATVKAELATVKWVLGILCTVSLANFASLMIIVTKLL